MNTIKDRTAVKAPLTENETHYQNAALADQNRILRDALKECADRLERCCRHAGNDAEIAASAVGRYRILLESIV